MTKFFKTADFALSEIFKIPCCILFVCDFIRIFTHGNITPGWEKRESIQRHVFVLIWYYVKP